MHSFPPGLFLWFVTRVPSQAAPGCVLGVDVPRKGRVGRCDPTKPLSQQTRPRLVAPERSSFERAQEAVSVCEIVFVTRSLQCSK